MRVGFEGWQRNHGMKMMLDQSVVSIPIVDSWDSLNKNQVGIKRYTTDGTQSGVTLNFYTDVRLGGGQIGEISLSRKELVHLLKGYAGDLTLETFAKWFSE